MSHSPLSTSAPPVTPDATLSLAVWLRKARRSKALRLLYCTRDLMKPKLWDVGEAGGFFHRYDSETETFEIKQRDEPASHRHRIAFHQEDVLPHFRPLDYCNHSESYPLEGTQRIDTCSGCVGSGSVSCFSCGGSGRQTDSEGKDQRCSSCGGSGNRTCGRCSGEGRLIQYKSKDYRWRHHVDEEYIVLKNLNRNNILNILTEIVEANAAIPVERFDISEIEEKTGVVNNRIRDTVIHARHRCRELETEINSRGRLLFQKVNRKYVPLGYVNLHLGRKFGQFFVAGGKKFRSRSRPPLRLCPWRLGFWALVLVGLIALLIQVLNPGISHKPEILWSFTALVSAFLTAAVAAWVVDYRSKPPPLWLVMDEDGQGGWLYVHALLYAHANGGLARVLDPFFTFLLNGNFYSDERHRNSFMCSVVERIQGTPKLKPRKLELIYINPRARQVFPDLVADLVQAAHRLTAVCGSESGVETLASSILKDHHARPSPSELEKIVWDSEDPLKKKLDNSDLPLQSNGSRLAAIYRESQWGRLSSRSESDLTALRERRFWPDENRRAL